MKVSFDDLKKVVEYLENSTNKGDVEIAVTIEDRLEIYTKDVLENGVTLRIFQADTKMFPRVIKEDTL